MARPARVRRPPAAAGGWFRRCSPMATRAKATAASGDVGHPGGLVPRVATQHEGGTRHHGDGHGDRHHDPGETDRLARLPTGREHRRHHGGEDRHHADADRPEGGGSPTGGPAGEDPEPAVALDEGQGGEQGQARPPQERADADGGFDRHGRSRGGRGPLPDAGRGRPAGVHGRTGLLRPDPGAVEDDDGARLFHGLFPFPIKPTDVVDISHLPSPGSMTPLLRSRHHQSGRPRHGR